MAKVIGLAEEQPKSIRRDRRKGTTECRRNSRITNEDTTLPSDPLHKKERGFKLRAMNECFRLHGQPALYT